MINIDFNLDELVRKSSKLNKFLWAIHRLFFIIFGLFKILFLAVLLFELTVPLTRVSSRPVASKLVNYDSRVLSISK